jgi:hypothetical protein
MSIIDNKRGCAGDRAIVGLKKISRTAHYGTDGRWYSCTIIIAITTKNPQLPY